MTGWWRRLLVVGLVALPVVVVVFGLGASAANADGPPRCDVRGNCHHPDRDRDHGRDRDRDDRPRPTTAPPTPVPAPSIPREPVAAAPANPPVPAAVQAVVVVAAAGNPPAASSPPTPTQQSAVQREISLQPVPTAPDLVDSPLARLLLIAVVAGAAAAAAAPRLVRR